MFVAAMNDANTIWGCGATEDEARRVGEINLKRHGHMGAELLMTYPASPRLALDVQKNGCPYKKPWIERYDKGQADLDAEDEADEHTEDVPRRPVVTM